MEMLNKEQKEKLEDIINYIIEAKEYKKCIKIKQEMKKNKEIIKLIEEIKLLQKKYIKENNKEIKENLKTKEKKLNNIPIYSEYNINLKKVNEMINLVRDELNDFFYNKLNKDIDL